MPILTRDDLLDRDREDPLQRFRDAFVMPEGVLYFDGNSLGPLPKATLERIDRAIRQEWGRDLIQSWNAHGWIDLSVRTGGKIARLIGASPDEVLACDSTSVNVFKLVAAAIRLQPGRPVILSDTENFPTDLYMVQGLCGLLGGAIELRLVKEAEIEQAIDSTTALVMLTQVNYRSGRRHDMAAITAAAHRAGALVLWDLSHSTGAFPIDLHGANADLAVGCGYKYLNGGPGAPAFLYVAKRHQHAFRQPLSGWLGHDSPFMFDLDYRPAQDIRRAQSGTPPILSLIGLDAAIDLMLEVDMNAVRRKSIELSSLFMALIDEQCDGHGFTVVTPREPEQRGSQVCLRHSEGYPIVQALCARRVICDFRAADILRFGLTPLYMRFADVWDAVAILREIMQSGGWRQESFQKRAAVT
jgi:kynureninase